MSGAVGVEGLAGMIRAAGRVDKQCSAELRRELRTTIGAHFAADAKARVEAEGLVKSRRLRNSIRPRVRGAIVEVRATATRRGFNYPMVHEFGNGGVRAFMGPTLDEWRASGRIEQEMEGFMDWVANEWRRS